VARVDIVGARDATYIEGVLINRRFGGLRLPGFYESQLWMRLLQFLHTTNEIEDLKVDYSVSCSIIYKVCM
jgi:hypothetical protein